MSFCDVNVERSKKEKGNRARHDSFEIHRTLEQQESTEAFEGQLMKKEEKGGERITDERRRTSKTADKRDQSKATQ